MLGKMYEGQDCSAARALEIVGERWSLLILRDAMFRGSTRFGEFQKALGIAPNILSKRLDDFVTAGLMEHRQTGAFGEHAEYHLTRKGLEMKPVIVALTAWGDKWVRPGPIDYVDGAGRMVEVQLRTAEGEVGVDEVGVKRR